MNEIFSVIITYWDTVYRDYRDEVYGTYKNEDDAYEVANKIIPKARFKLGKFAFGIEDEEVVDIYDVRVTMRCIDEQHFDEEFFEGEREDET